MLLIHSENFESHRNEVIEAIRAGKIFIYPTDTIYGLGCDATSETAVAKLRAMKERPDDRPLSIIAPSKEWILENCLVPDPLVLEKLPGPFTLIFALKNKEVVAPNVNMRDDTLGVRIPSHWFSKVVSEAGVPFVTTSVNVSGEKFMKKMSDIPKPILETVDFVIYEGEKKGVPSTKLRFV